MKTNNKLVLFVMILVLLVSALAIASPTLASTYTPQTYDWCTTEADCLEKIFAATQEPTEATPEPTEETATPEPTEEVTNTPEVTETVLPTETVTETPAPPTETAPPLPTDWEERFLTPDPATTEAAGGKSCYNAWQQILGVNKETGYRFFDNPAHSWCQTWLFNEYGVDYELYKIANP